MEMQAYFARAKSVLISKVQFILIHSNTPEMKERRMLEIWEKRDEK